MIPELKTGIFNLIAGSTFETQIGVGKTKFKKVKKGTLYPYSVINQVSSLRSIDSGSVFERTVVQFSIFDGSNSTKGTLISSARINSLGEKLKTLFQDSENVLVVVGYKVENVKRTGYIDVPTENENVHGLAVSFTFVLQK